MIEPTWPVLLAGFCGVLLMAISKAGLGGGLGALATPIVALTMSVPQAVAVMLPLLFLMDALGLWNFRKDLDLRILKIILPGALVGTAAGWLLFGLVDSSWIKVILGAECLIFAALRLRTGALNAEAKPARILPGVFFSSLSSFASFISHAGSPPLMQYLLPIKLPKAVFVGVCTVFFALVNLTKWVPYGALGLLNWDNLWISFLLIPAVPLGFWIGVRFLHHVSQRSFDRIITWGLILTGTKLLWDASIVWRT